MAVFGSRRGAASKATIPLMVLSFALIIGFMYWLNITAEPTTVMATEGDTGGDEVAGTRVSLADLQLDASAYSSQTIQVSGVNVTSRLGDQAFWTTLPNEQPYLVRMGADLVAQGMSVAQGDVADLVVGSIHMMSDSVLDAWASMGAFTDDVQRIEAEFATSFLEAERIDLRGGSGGGASR